MNLLVLHGPNLNLLGEREGDGAGTLEELNQAIGDKARALGMEVKVLQTNHEGQLIDTLHAERRWADGIIINPGALSHYSYALRDALAAVGIPAMEVHLTDIRRRESWRRKSVIKDVCVGQVLGKGFDSYLIALDRFASRNVAGRRKAKPPAPRKTPIRPNLPPPPKTLGRGVVSERKTPAKTLGRRTDEDRNRLTSRMVREKISERLRGTMTASGLATWARSAWQQIQRGAPVESGQREVLEDTLQSLLLSAQPASRLSEDELVELLTQLEK